MAEAENIVKRFSAMASSRGTWDAHWDEIGDLMFPNHPTFVGEESPGTKKGLEAYDGTAIHAIEMLAAGFHGNLTNPASEWFEILLDNDEANKKRQVRIWLQDAQDVMYKEIRNAKTAFTTHIHEMYMEFSGFGTGVLFIGETGDRDGVLFKAIPLSDAYIAENADGIVDTLYRKIHMTIRQVVDKWGYDNVSEKVQKKFDSEKFDEKVIVLHAVEPDTSKKAKLPFKSCYVERDSKHMLQQGGFKNFPYAVPRFYKAAGEVYGRGPGVTALPDVKMLNEMMKTTIRAAQKMVDPPLMAPDDGFINPIRTIPGGINYYRVGTKERIEPMDFGGNLPISVEMTAELRQRIQRVFFVDLLELPHKAERVTATEIMQRTEDKLRLMGPILGRMQAEALNTVIKRTFNILFEQGKIPEPPFDLSQYNLVIEYISPIARAQKQLEAGGLQRVLEVMSPFISSKPQILNKFDDTEILKSSMDMFGVRPTFLKDDDTIKTEEEEEKQAQMMAQAAETLDTGASAVQKLQPVVGGVGNG